MTLIIYRIFSKVQGDHEGFIPRWFQGNVSACCCASVASQNFTSIDSMAHADTQQLSTFRETPDLEEDPAISFSHKAGEHCFFEHKKEKIQICPSLLLGPLPGLLWFMNKGHSINQHSFRGQKLSHQESAQAPHGKQNEPYSTEQRKQIPRCGCCKMQIQMPRYICPFIS